MLLVWTGHNPELLAQDGWSSVEIKWLQYLQKEKSKGMVTNTTTAPASQAKLKQH